MKKGFCFALMILMLCASTALAGGEPNIVGTWKGLCQGHTAEKGFANNNMVFEIIEQKGAAFHGVKTYYAHTAGKEKSELFSGTVDIDGSIHTSEYKDGTCRGKVKGDTMTLQYTEDGAKAKSFYYLLKRQ